jgi:hypothetical protein
MFSYVAKTLFRPAMPIQELVSISEIIASPLTTLLSRSPLHLFYSSLLPGLPTYASCIILGLLLHTSNLRCLQSKRSCGAREMATEQYISSAALAPIEGEDLEDFRVGISTKRCS